MNARRPGRFGRRRLRSARFRRSRRGVVSVVGTLLSLLVFFALFGVFLTQYLPLWMAQNESVFSNQAQASVETLKQYVDDQLVFGGPHTYSVPFTLSSNGIPLFAQPTVGSVAFLNGCAGNIQSNGTPVNPTACSFQRLSFSVLTPTADLPPCPSGYTFLPPLTNQTVTLTSATNYLQMQLPNRYYPGQTFFFEDDAAIESQSGGHQLMLVPPPLNMTNSSANVTFTSSFAILEGNTSSYSAQGSKDVYSTLIATSAYTSSNRFAETCQKGSSLVTQTVPFDVTYAVGTHNPCAWYNFLKNSTVQAGIKLGTAPPPLYGYPSGTAGAVLDLTGPGLLAANAASNQPTASMCSNPSGSTYNLALIVYNVNYLQAYSGVAQISFTNGGL